MKLPTRREALVNTAAALSAAVFTPTSLSRAIASDGPSITHNVEIRKFKFVPDHLLAKPGDTIVWTNLDIAPHTATANDRSWDTGMLKKGQSKSVTVSEIESGGYFCRFHPHMKADLQIEQKDSL